jgi:glycine C-acetyltransferase
MMGKTSAGTGEHFGVQDKIDLYFATFAKAMAGIGGFVLPAIPIFVTICVITCVRRLMPNRCQCRWLLVDLKRLELIRTKPELKEKLWTVVENSSKRIYGKPVSIWEEQTLLLHRFL